MNRLVLLAFPLLLCAACSREEPASPAATAPDAPAPAATPSMTAAPAAPPALQAPTPADPTAAFDVGAFAGTFVAEGIRLELHADGTYGLEGSDGITSGSWTHEAGSRSIRLDPGSKTAQDRVLSMTDNDTLALDGTTLRRQPAS